MTRSGMAFAGIAAMYVGAAHAAQGSTFPACADDVGTKVRYVTEEQYNERGKGQLYMILYAAARYMDSATQEEPAITYSPTFIDSIGPMARNFVFLHECFHLSSGDARKAYLAFQGGNKNVLDVRRMEYNADCSAAKRLRDEFHATEEDIKAMQPVLLAVSGGRGEKRMEEIMGCYRTP